MTRSQRRLVALTGSVLSTVILVRAQQTPPRDMAATPTRIGTAAIAGVIASAEKTSRPLRRVSVTLTSTEGNLTRARVTDDDGRFEFANLPPGRYAIGASRPGFVATAFGAKRPAGQGSAITLAEGQRVSNIDLKLARGAVITGTLRDQNGEPMAGAYVSVMRYSYSYLTGERVLVRSSGGFGQATDDGGMYRVYGLPAGEYYVLGLRGIGPSAGEGFQLMTTADVQWAARQTQQGPQAAGGAGPPPATTSVTYAPVFYPGTTVQSNAAAVSVSAGEERSGVDISMVLVPTSKVTGTIVSADGPVPPDLRVNLIALDRIEGVPFSGFGTASAVKDGHFTFNGLTPGQYTIAVRAAAGSVPGQRGVGTGQPSSAAAQSLYGRADITVTGRDLAVTVTLQPGVTVSGRVNFEGTTLKPPADLTRIRVNLGAARSKEVSLGVPQATVDASGAFRFVGVTPGRYQMSATVPGAGPSGGWQLKGAIADGHDAIDGSFDVGSSDVADIALTFSDQSSELSGKIQDDEGHPTPEYFVIVFPTDKTYWTPQSRRIQAKRPSSDGHFTISNLPPGEYWIGAANDPEQGQWFDPSFLQELSASSIKITIGEGEKKVQDLRIR